MRRLSWLDAVFAGAGPRPFLYWRDQAYSYDWLRAAVADCGRVLEDRRIKSGATVALDGDYSPRTIALLLALIERGCISVPLSPAARTQREEFLGIGEVQYSLRVTEDDQYHIEKSARQVNHPLLKALADAGDPGLLVFSSGSSGKSKAALHNFRLILEKFKIRRPSFITVTFLMLDHLGGINTLFYVLSNGGSAIALSNRDPEHVCAMIEKYRVELLPTSPTFLNLMLISEAYKHFDLSSLKRVSYGTEVMTDALLERLHRVFPSVQLQQTYGLSELGVLRSKSRDSNSLWMKIGGEGFETRIKENTLWIKAQSAMLGYLNAAAPFDEEGWFDTGDAVETDGEYVRILGRKSEIINVGGQKVYPAEVESILLEIPNVSEVSVCGEPNAITGHVVRAQFNLHSPEEAAAFRQRVRSFCDGKLASFKTPVKILIAEGCQHTQRFKKIRGSGYAANLSRNS